MKINSVFIIIALFTCCKRDTEVQQSNCMYDNFIITGINSKCMVYRDFIPDIELDSLKLDSTPEVNINNLSVDINNDQIYDVTFQTVTDHLPTSNYYATQVIPLNTQSNKISLNAKALYYYSAGPMTQTQLVHGEIKQFTLNDTLNSNKGFWSPTQPFYSNGDSLVNIYYDLAYSSNPACVWHNVSNKFIGFSFIQGNDTLYGWMRISIIGYTHIIIHDCAYQTKN